MRLDAKSGLRGEWIDRKTGQRIRWVIWGDVETGEYEAYRIEPKQAKERGIPLQAIRYQGLTQLQFIPLTVQVPPRVRPRAGGLGAESSSEPVRRGFLNPLDLFIPECEEPLCHRRASWWTADEQELEPASADGRLYEVAKTVTRHYWCDWHYRWPVLTSLRGVEREVTETRARPQ